MYAAKESRLHFKWIRVQSSSGRTWAILREKRVTGQIGGKEKRLNAWTAPLATLCIGSTFSKFYNLKPQRHFVNMLVAALQKNTGYSKTATRIVEGWTGGGRGRDLVGGIRQPIADSNLSDPWMTIFTELTGFGLQNPL
jgi:hypothetical protein